MATARERLALAHTAFDAGFHSGAVSAAYYAMLYAARAALSEHDLNAKTDTGTWRLFAERFVKPGDFDRELYTDAQDTQRLREEADYDARAVSADDAAGILAHAERFVAAIEALF